MRETCLAFGGISLLIAGSTGCKSDKTSSDRIQSAPPGIEASTTTATIDAAAVATPEPAAAEKPVYRSFKGRTFYFGTERRGDAVRAVYYASAPPVDFRGKATDATHFSVRQEHVPKGAKAMSIAGEWSPDGSTLTATLTDPSAKKTTPLSSNDGPFAGRSRTTFKTDFKGSLGGRFIRMRLEQDGAKLSGLYRYARSAEDIALAGSVVDKDGTFDLTESVKGKVTGKFSGVFVSLSAMLATWSSPDGSHSFPVEMKQGDGYPETIDLGSGLSMYPQETMIEGVHCQTDIVVPQVRGGKDKAQETLLNGLLRGDHGGVVTSCEGPGPEDVMGIDYEESDGYSLLTQKRGRFVSLSQSGYSYSGGAHGMSGSTCAVVDTRTLTRFRMVDSLTKEGRDKLGDKVTESLSLQDSGDGGALTDRSYFNDHIEIGTETNVCLYDAEIKVEFMPYEIAPYFMGAPVVVFPKAEVRALFEKNEWMDGVFAQ